MKTWQVSLINPILNFRRIAIVNAETYLQAIGIAESQLKSHGFVKLEYCIIKHIEISTDVF